MGLTRVNGEYLIEVCMMRPFSENDCMAQCQKKFTHAVIGLPSDAVFSCTIQMNKALTEDEMAEQIEVEAYRIVPYPLEEVYYDFHVLGISKTHPELVDVLFAAAKIETVKAQRMDIEKIGLTVGVVDLNSLAMERAFSWIAHPLPNRGANQWVALFDIGTQWMTCYVFYDFKIQCIRTHSRNLDAQCPMNAMIEDVQMVLQQLNVALSDSIIQSIVLGGEAAIAFVEESAIDIHVVERSLGVKTIVANPFANMRFSPHICIETLLPFAPSFMLSLGLALRNFDDAY